MRMLLAPFFPANILDKALWNVYDASRATLDSLILASDCSDLHLPFNIDCKMGGVTLDNFAFVYASPGAYSLEKQAYDWQATVRDVIRKHMAQPTDVVQQTYVAMAPGPRPPLRRCRIGAAP